MYSGRGPSSQSLFEHSFSREPWDCHNSAEAFLTELQFVAAKAVGPTTR
jgi:hypothetical protein